MRPMHRLLMMVSLIALALAVVIAAGCSSGGSGAATNAETVTASGSGTIQAAPDEATMQFGFRTQADTAKKALADASKAAQKIVDALTAQGVDKADIRTSNVSIYPQMDYADGKSVVRGYEGAIDVTVELTDMDRIGDVITAANEAGANTVSGPSFGIDDDGDQRRQAIKKAVDDARKNAKAMAEAAGKSVGEVVSISDSEVSVPVPFVSGERAMKEALDSSVPIETGQLEVTARLTVVFELK